MEYNKLIISFIIVYRSKRIKLVNILINFILLLSLSIYIYKVFFLFNNNFHIKISIDIPVTKIYGNNFRLLYILRFVMLLQ